VLYTLALHYTAFGSTVQEELHMGSRSPEEAARWRAALTRVRDRADSFKGSSGVAGAGKESAGAAAGAKAGATSHAQRAAIGHVPTMLRDVQEMACLEPPLGRASSSVQSGVVPPPTPATTSPAPATSPPEYQAADKHEAEEHPSPREEGPSVVQPDDSPRWRLVRLTNGLRIFEGTPGTAGTGWGAAPVAKASCKVQAASELVFRLVMDLSARSRAQWDCHYSTGTVVQQLDGHTDIIHVTFRKLHCLFRRRDVVLTRYWRREEDGSYIVLFRSTEHPQGAKPLRGVVRAEVACGCIIVTPLGEQCCLLTHVLEASPNGWALPWTGLPRLYQYALLNTVAGIRDFLEQLSAANAASVEVELMDPLGVLLRTSDMTDDEEGSDEEGHHHQDNRRSGARRDGSSSGALNDNDSLSRRASQDTDTAAPQPAAPVTAATAPSADGTASAPATPQPAAPTSLPRTSSNVSPSGPGSALKRSPSIRRSVSIEGPGPTRSVTAYEPFATNISGLPADGNGGGSLPFGLWPAPGGGKATNVWCRPTGNRFVLRSKSYLETGIKVCAGTPIMHLVATDWLTDEHRIDHICARPAGTCQRTLLSAADKELRVVCVNLQVPGAKPFSIIFYFAHAGPVEPGSSLDKFWHGDDAYRNCRFKLIPSITEGAWAVQRSVGTKPLIVGNALRTTYHGGGDSRYLEMDVDIGSNSVANSVTRFVMVYLKTLVIDLGFVVEGKTEEELPERLIGALIPRRPDILTAAN
jgi:hypothetical protein